jgi:hypothetical protein
VRVILHTKCRKCETCMQKRAAQWRLRAKSEHGYAARTWFGTLTFRPDIHLAITSQARMYFVKNGLDYEQEPERVTWPVYHRIAAGYVQRWYKQLRKAGCSLRYLQVAERHKSGLIHFHVLIHEQSPDDPIRHKTLSGTWSHGFCNFKLATETNQITYLCKYLTKDAATASVRASLRYGQGPVTSKDQANGVQRDQRPSPLHEMNGETAQ